MTDVIQNFDRAAEVYEAQAIAQTALADALAQWVATDERQGVALEFGAGTGLFTRRMLPWDGVYTATDAAPRMVARGRVACPNAIWQQQDARQPRSSQPADWIFACNLLQWLDEPAATLSEWQKCLAPDGQLVIAVLLHDTLPELQSVLPEVSPLRGRTASQWQHMVEQAGFRVKRVETWEFRATHPSALAFLRSLHAMGLAPNRIVGPGRLRTALRDYDRKFTLKDGVYATWKSWLVRAITG